MRLVTLGARPSLSGGLFVEPDFMAGGGFEGVSASSRRRRKGKSLTFRIARSCQHSCSQNPLVLEGVVTDLVSESAPTRRWLYQLSVGSNPDPPVVCEISGIAAI